MKKRKQAQRAIADAAFLLKEVEDRIKNLKDEDRGFVYPILREERIIKRERLYSLLIAN